MLKQDFDSFDDEELTFECKFVFMIEQLYFKYNYLHKKYNSHSLTDIDEDIISIILKITKMANSFHSVMIGNKDFVSANVILRSILESVSSFSMIYCKSDGDERLLRHFLYLIDGLRSESSFLKNNFKDIEPSKSESYEQTKKAIDTIIKNDSDEINLCIISIKKLDIYKSNKQPIDCLINNANWRYNEIPEKLERRSWKEIIHIGLGSPSDILEPYLSWYVHGLSITNYSLNEEKIFDGLFKIAYQLIHKFNEEVDLLYAKDLKGSEKEMKQSIASDKGFLCWFCSRYNKHLQG